MRKCGISVHLLHWQFISFTVPNTLDRVTFSAVKIASKEIN